ncbi:hypothetical protein XENOCAPTIV_006766, partial [Xenoophorus captivus]
PNPPGPIEILSKTTDSIDLLWGAAPLMSTASGYFYKLTYNPLQQTVNSSNLEKFLVKTYDDWKHKSAQVYLATVVSYITTSRSSINPLEISVGTKSTWKVYKNDVLDPSGTYK